MELVTNKQQLIKNIETLERYLTEGDEIEMNEASSLVRRGICFIVYKARGELRFAPSRFIGYVDNNLDAHSISPDKDGRITNGAIEAILHSKPSPNDSLEENYFTYANRLGINPNVKAPFNVQRKFWMLDAEISITNDSETSEDFPEGNMVERKHKARERNNQVIALAKDKFKRKHGRLFCQVCGFDFEKTYGEIGKDFIEAHHTIAVSEMESDHKTKVEDIAMLCSNCHRMVHKRRPWLTMNELTKLV